MQFLWFIAGADGSVTMKMRGNPLDWQGDVKGNLMTAFAELIEEMMGDEVIEYEVDDNADNVIHLKLKQGQSHE